MIEFYSLDFTIEMQGVGTVKRSGGGEGSSSNKSAR